MERKMKVKGLSKLKENEPVKSDAGVVWKWKEGEEISLIREDWYEVGKMIWVEK